MGSARDWETHNLLGVPIGAATMEQVLSLADSTISDRGSLHIGMVNAAKLVNMRKNPALRESVLTSDLILADGMSVVWAARLLGRRLPERVTGIDLMDRLFEQGSKRGYRVYCLGAKQEVLDETVRRINEQHPGVVVAGARNGYFDPSDEPQIIEDINASNADILLVAMSPPKKEQFLGRWARDLNVPICHGVGGAFDVFAGKVRRAPVLWQRLGLEWLYRVVQEPGRLWRRYLVTNTMFGWLVLCECFGRLMPRSSRGPKRDARPV
jgi:exopolysaccharide biosynthesis WecB/TagA/CpsF family protein